MNEIPTSRCSISIHLICAADSHEGGERFIQQQQLRTIY